MNHGGMAPYSKGDVAMRTNLRKRAALAAMLFTVALPSSALAQFSESYNFIKAVKDRDGAKANEIIAKPGSIIIDTREQGTGDAAIHIVTKRRDMQWMGFLLSRGAKPDVRDNQGNTALNLAAQIGFTEGAAQLLRFKASVDLANNSGETPLIRAVQMRDLPMARMLLAAGANPAKTDRIAGMSARDYAQRDTRAKAILALIDSAKSIKPAAGPNP